MAGQRMESVPDAHPPEAQAVTRRRVVVLFSGGDRHESAQALLDEAYDCVCSVEDAASAGPVSVVGVGSGAAAALAAAAAQDPLVDRLVLLSPSIGEQQALASIEIPALVIIGSDDALGAVDARRCSEEMASCYLMLVYSAGIDVAGDRPAATASLIEHFLEAGETFPVRTSTHKLHP